MRLISLLMGVAFGFLMSKAGATDFDYYAQLFLFKDMQLLWVIATAILVGIPGILLFKKLKVQSVFGDPIDFEDKPWRKGLLWGALIFGIGWGLTGSCPGSIPAMLGEGKLAILPTLFGVMMGTYMYACAMDRRSGKCQPKED